MWPSVNLSAPCSWCYLSAVLGEYWDLGERLGVVGGLGKELVLNFTTRAGFAEPGLPWSLFAIQE